MSGLKSCEKLEAVIHALFKKHGVKLDEAREGGVSYLPGFSAYRSGNYIDIDGSDLVSAMKLKITPYGWIPDKLLRSKALKQVQPSEENMPESIPEESQDKWHEVAENWAELIRVRYLESDAACKVL